ncbi:hypothetical protein N657DRAFT_637099 [Parathielavia appendiculata]|uniref:Uncharacterized protein n=1 Tax=Parathielavia appendiculata TaxID=2587402 RepID=A0AAN6YZW6_9PEZI|nr:hypothetical protein N657DRAFT_637099 [Parathielavia appendiculata]
MPSDGLSAPGADDIGLPDWLFGQRKSAPGSPSSLFDHGEPVTFLQGTFFGAFAAAHPTPGPAPKNDEDNHGPSEGDHNSLFSEGSKAPVEPPREQEGASPLAPLLDQELVPGLQPPSLPSSLPPAAELVTAQPPADGTVAVEAGSQVASATAGKKEEAKPAGFTMIGGLSFPVLPLSVPAATAPSVPRTDAVTAAVSTPTPREVGDGTTISPFQPPLPLAHSRHDSRPPVPGSTSPIANGVPVPLPTLHNSVPGVGGQHPEEASDSTGNHNANVPAGAGAAAHQCAALPSQSQPQSILDIATEEQRSAARAGTAMHDGDARSPASYLPQIHAAASTASSRAQGSPQGGGLSRGGGCANRRRIGGGSNTTAPAAARRSAPRSQPPATTPVVAAPAPSRPSQQRGTGHTAAQNAVNQPDFHSQPAPAYFPCEAQAHRFTFAALAGTANAVNAAPADPRPLAGFPWPLPRAAHAHLDHGLDLATQPLFPADARVRRMVADVAAAYPYDLNLNWALAWPVQWTASGQSVAGYAPADGNAGGVGAARRPAAQPQSQGAGYAPNVTLAQGFGARDGLYVNPTALHPSRPVQVQCVSQGGVLMAQGGMARGGMAALSGMTTSAGMATPSSRLGGTDPGGMANGGMGLSGRTEGSMAHPAIDPRRRGLNQHAQRPVQAAYVQHQAQFTAQQAPVRHQTPGVLGMMQQPLAQTTASAMAMMRPRHQAQADTGLTMGANATSLYPAGMGVMRPHDMDPGHGMMGGDVLQGGFGQGGMALGDLAQGGGMAPPGMAQGSMTQTSLAPGGMASGRMTPSGMTSVGTGSGGMAQSAMTLGGIARQGSMAQGGFVQGGIQRGMIYRRRLAQRDILQGGIPQRGTQPGMALTGIPQGGMPQGGMAQSRMTLGTGPWPSMAVPGGPRGPAQCAAHPLHASPVAFDSAAAAGSFLQPGFLPPSAARDSVATRAVVRGGPGHAGFASHSVESAAAGGFVPFAPFTGQERVPEFQPSPPPPSPPTLAFSAPAQTPIRRRHHDGQVAVEPPAQRRREG